MIRTLLLSLGILAAGMVVTRGMLSPFYQNIEMGTVTRLASFAAVSIWVVELAHEATANKFPAWMTTYVVCLLLYLLVDVMDIVPYITPPVNILWNNVWTLFGGHLDGFFG